MFFGKNIIRALILTFAIFGATIESPANVDLKATMTGVPSQSTEKNDEKNSVSEDKNIDKTENKEIKSEVDPETAQRIIANISDIDRLFEETKQFFGKSYNFLIMSKGKLIVLLIGLTISYLLSLVINYLFHAIFMRFAKKTSFIYDDQLCDALRTPITVLIFIIGACLSSLPFLSMCSPTIFTLIIRLFLVAGVVDITWGCFRIMDVLGMFLSHLATLSTNNIDDLLVEFIRKAAKTILTIIAVFLCGETILELNITALLTTAGIAGLAIAFAAKDTIANFLSSIMIILDKPFKIGDRIRSSNFDGIVEGVGFRSSRIRALDGNLFIIPNYQLADMTIENVTARPNIRYIFDLTLIYATTPAQMKQAREILIELTANAERFLQGDNAPAVVFSDFKDWALNINIKVWFNTTDWVESQKWRNELNLQILERFNAAGLSFAFPTNTTVLTTEESAPVIVKKID